MPETWALKMGRKEHKGARKLMKAERTFVISENKPICEQAECMSEKVARPWWVPKLS